MGTFRHTADDIIYINTTSFPLSFFLTVEAAYALPSGMVQQYYEQTVKRTASNSLFELYYDIPWTDGDSYIANEATYSAAYTSYLNTPPSLSAAQTSVISDLYLYARNIKIGHVVDAGEEYFSHDALLKKLVNEDLTYTRAGVLPGTYYVNDVMDVQIPMATLSDLESIIDGIVNLHYQVDLNFDTHKAAINALTTIPDVLAYDYTTGWPTVPFNACLTFYASYATSINADYAGGSATGTAFGGAAIASSWLDLAHNDTRYVTYVATANADAQQIGTLVFNFKPNYSGIPASNQYMFSISQSNVSDNNLITLRHLITSGQLNLTIKNNVGATIVNKNFGVWSPILGTEYKITFHYDITAGNTFVRIDNIAFGTTDTTTGTRNSSIGLLTIGNAYNGAVTSNFSINDLRICSD